MTKYCPRCKQTKSLDEFSSNRSRPDGKGSCCTLCARQYRQDHYKNNKDKVIAGNKRRRQDNINKLWDVKHNPCKDCGLVDPIVMEFDHIGDDKEHNVSRMVDDGYAWSKILQEIAKCEMVCANCHRRRTFARGNWKRDRIIKVEVMRM